MLSRGLSGVHDAFTWLTVLPLPQPRGEFDRRRAATVIAAVPIVGAALGAVIAVIAFGLSYTALPTALIGVGMVAVLALATRGMHLDGLADTVDGLGSYGDADRVRAIMRSGDVGPFGAASLVLVLLGESVAFGALAADSRWYEIALAIFVSRATVPISCRSGLGAANADGFGALVAGTQRASIVVWSALALAAAAATGLVGTDGQTLDVAAAVQATAVVVVVLFFAWFFTRHCARRSGGLTGDVIGATIEFSVVLTAVGLLL
ncbi:adenosylcobinamide-GDP ribazoletransferase [Gordonia neofelifaecis]|uniref:Adenosylcobinamide-GDP ribazoletransferase n=1 Tax=Gordonia neofelifaecis NRRL B-59395 TaxID=644548 RepID=F1YHG8_9ACTN|nr:adenosylcobinamide-GDP ribazoletransferase [Gordonia neofelifaecis]EGD55806.1 cobalamin synthase [Gordonia neofelifaecis NRRL B-59395]